MAEISDDEVLVGRFNQGDVSVFDRIVQQHTAEIAVLANRLLGWPGDVEDITQDIFLAAYLGLRKFRCDCSLRSWLFTITINKCRSYRCKRMRQLKSFSRVADRSAFTRDRAADKTSMDSETFERVRRAIAALPPKYREPVVLRYLQELSTGEISRILGISENTLQVRLTRARKHLRRYLAELMEQ